MGTWITKQLVFDGFVQGLAIALVAVGIVLIYRATRVINFAVGNMGLVGAGLLALMVVQYHVPFGISLVVSLLVGTLFAVIMELAVIRRLFTAPRVILLVATIGIAQLALTAATAYPKIDRCRRIVPGCFDQQLAGRRRHDCGISAVDPCRGAAPRRRSELVPRGGR